MISESS